MVRRRDPSPRTRAKKPKIADDEPWLHDMMSVLFETPSGFAIFHCCASLIEDKDVLEVLWDKFTSNCKALRLVWLKRFKTFEDKSSAITQNAGVNKKLSQMIQKGHSPWMKLAVGNPEYKQIIEDHLNISCVHGPAVMELMWGIQHCMHSLVPKEVKELTEADRLPMSQGLHTVLSRYGCVVKQEMVTELIVKTASALFWCDNVEKENCGPLENAGKLIKHVSGINCDNWNPLKIATAVKAIWCPEEIGDSCEEISADEVSRLVKDRHKYEVYMDKYGCLRVYEEMMSAYHVKRTNEKQLRLLVERAEASEAKQVNVTPAYPSDSAVDSESSIRAEPGRTSTEGSPPSAEDTSG